MKKPQSSPIFDDSDYPMCFVRKSIFQGTGVDLTEAGKRPIIAIANSLTEINPGHMHLGMIAQRVKDGVNAAGGLPFEFDVPAPCDGMTEGHAGMRFVLAQRDLIADIIETHVRSMRYDGIVFIASCDKIIPGMIMAAARLDLPAIFVTGGPNVWDIRFKPSMRGAVDHKCYTDLFDKLATATAATCGSCELMGTANTMQCLAEAAGMTLPFAATARAVSAERLRLGKASGEAIVRMVFKGETARSIMGLKNLENMLRVCMALGGSTNGVLHILALAGELGLEKNMNIGRVDEFSRTTPCISNVQPVGKYYLPDLHEDGGMPAIMAELKPLLNLQARGVDGRTLKDWIKLGAPRLQKVRRSVLSLKKPLLAHGGIAVLKGNLAPISSLARMLNNTIPSHRGPARCFNSQKEAVTALKSGKVKEGEVIVVRHEGPRGAPGMPDIYALLATVVGMGLEGKLAVVTDGRFSGFARGLGVCQVSPEAAVGGPLALLKNGDMISINLHARSLNAEVSDQEWKKRRSQWRPLERKNAPGILGLFAVNAEQAHQGARLVAHPAPLE